MSHKLKQLKGYEFYIDLIEKKYMASVDNYDLNAVLDCFNEYAVYVHQSSFSTYTGRDTEIKTIFMNLFKNYPGKMVHKDFRHVIDLENERIASQYVSEIATEDGKEIFLSNCSFFYFENGKFKEVYNYMSEGHNPLAG